MNQWSHFNDILLFHIAISTELFQSPEKISILFIIFKVALDLF